MKTKLEDDTIYLSPIRHGSRARTMLLATKVVRFDRRLLGNDQCLRIQRIDQLQGSRT